MVECQLGTVWIVVLPRYTLGLWVVLQVVGMMDRLAEIVVGKFNLLQV